MSDDTTVFVDATDQAVDITPGPPPAGSRYRGRAPRLAAAVAVLIGGVLVVLLAPPYLRGHQQLNLAESPATPSATGPYTGAPGLTGPDGVPAGPSSDPSGTSSTSGTATGPGGTSAAPGAPGTSGAASATAGPSGGKVTAQERLTAPVVSAAGPATSAAPATSRPARGAALFGMAAGSGLPTLSQAQLDARLAGMAAIGGRWVRFDLEWANVQPVSASGYTWSDYDRVVDAVVAHGLTPLVIIDTTPPWARAGECPGNRFCRPANPAAFAAFAAAAVTRYAPRGVHTWEIWNEPNLTQYYAPKPDPAQYAGLLAATYPRIKAADASAVILTGGTSATATARDGTTVRATDFLSALYDAGAKGSFDAVAHHPYTWPYSPQTAFPGSAWDDLSVLHSIMASHGDGAKKVWSTEYGAPTGGNGATVTTDVQTVQPSPNHVSEALQAMIIQKSVSLYRTYSFVGPLLWYSYQDAGTGDTVEDHFGVIRADGSPKPGLAALTSAFGG